ncbi:unnamed protein product [Moneuplotes crassus]|uniref:Transmembrane protein 198 n=1 Tax=Euplotes crassus TaxID=5936 RepID=A0A7S3KU51_EUPCR|nr:unnamed protein product [Moneuplotes crassus]|mmetsp:Transcript_7981/g.7548  ORF Transcript_7981/g.7548 Transcript_7981/m.7548 type:complete len:420 (+) Transcript_7981:2-1261(+)|eukprot:CAMPEP_0197003590 /NCGR_PEP_ID=MMETSP1380-20130617/8943_1 /TAXON_ID=5936 /ORGANISM="Euplotes crassus, Strain CT5" /LENGTH=419 /DNA_ID=CAMNT_0042422141 /DNA_START=1 /DNA_END=1260 /DNA_ORIENTATION=-
MKSSLCILLACLVFASATNIPEGGLSSQFSINCFHTLDYTFFNLEPLRKQGDGEFHTMIRTVGGVDEYEVNFDFCEALPEVRSCKDVSPLAVESNREEQFADSCRQLTKHHGQDQDVSLQKTDSENSERFIQISHTTNLQCEGETNFGVTFEIFCDKDQQDLPVFTENVAKSTDCRPVFRTHHNGGCQVGDLGALWRFVEANSIIFGIASMVIGFYNLILGRKFIKPTIGLIFLVTVVAVIMFFFYVFFLPRTTAKWVGWLILSISVVLGGIVGFFASKLVRIGVIVLGFWAGVGIGLLLNNLVFYHINHVSVVWILMGVFGLTLSVLSFFWYNYIVIICTSILGSYFFVRGIALMAGGYPNEFTIYSSIRNNSFQGMPGTFWAYVAGMVVACALGIIIQLFIKKREGKKETDDVYKRV